MSRLRICAGWSEPLLVAHTTLLVISCRGSNLKVLGPIKSSAVVLFIVERCQLIYI